MSTQVFCFRSGSVGGMSAASYSSFPCSMETHTNELERQTIWAVAGTFRNLIITLASAPGAGKSLAFTVRKNAADTTVTVTISGTSTTGRDTSNSFTVAPGDELSLMMVPTGTPTTPGSTGVMASIEFESTTAKESGHSWGPLAVASASNRWQGVFANASAWNATAGANVETVVAAPGDITALYLNNGLGTQGGGSKTYTVHIYKNGVKQDGSGGTPNTGVAIVGTATQANGTFTLSVVAGDRLYVECVPTNTPSAMGLGCGFRFVATTDGQSNFCGISPNLSTAATAYGQPEGEATTAWTATEANAVAYAGITPFVLSGQQVLLTTGSPGAGKSYTLSARRNSATPGSPPSVTISDSATTGSDLVNSVSYVDGDTLTLRNVPAGTPTARVASWGFIQTISSAITGSAVFGVTTTVNATRAVAFGLDNAVNTHSEVGKLKVFGDFEVTGISTLEGVPVRFAQVAISSAEILALRATPKTLVAAPGAGKIAEFAGLLLLLDATATAYIEVAANLSVKYTNGSGAKVSEDIEATGFIDQTTDTMTTARPKLDAIVAKAGCENQALVLHNLGAAEYITGTGVMRVKCAYRIWSTGW